MTTTLEGLEGLSTRIVFLTGAISEALHQGSVGRQWLVKGGDSPITPPQSRKLERKPCGVHSCLL